MSFLCDTEKLDLLSIDDKLEIFSRILPILKKAMTREDFMAFFRNEEKVNLLSNDDRHEIFSTILSGSSDFTKELLDEILSDYCVSDLIIIEQNEWHKISGPKSRQ